MLRGAGQAMGSQGWRPGDLRGGEGLRSCCEGLTWLDTANFS